MLLNAFKLKIWFKTYSIIGAISLYKDGQLSALDGDLTYAGSIMADLPIDVRLAKLSITCSVFLIYLREIMKWNKYIKLGEREQFLLKFTKISKILSLYSLISF